MPSNEQEFIELAQKRVESAAGVKRFHKPVGAVIGDARDPDGGGPGPGSQGKKVVTLERMLSLQRQYVSARKVGDKNRMRSIMETFRREGAIYAKGRSMQEVMEPLDAAYAKMLKEERKSS